MNQFLVFTADYLPLPQLVECPVSLSGYQFLWRTFPDLITDYSHSLELVRLPPLSPLRGERFPYFSDSPLRIRLFTTFGSGKLSVVFRWFVVTSMSALSALCQAIQLALRLLVESAFRPCYSVRLGLLPC